MQNGRMQNGKMQNGKFELITTCGNARRGRMHTVHGEIETPVFMNVGTAAAIRGGAGTDDLRRIGCQVELSNTYHLHIRPGDELIRKLGGLHKFMNWDAPILTDSGGFQVFSLAHRRELCFIYRWEEDFHGSGGIHAYPIQSCVNDRNGI